jgi:hypothetical protein
MRLHYNENVPSDMIPIYPMSTNDTLFTACCGCAILDREKGCPECGRPVVGDEAETDHERGNIRRANASRYDGRGW